MTGVDTQRTALIYTHKVPSGEVQRECVETSPDMWTMLYNHDTTQHGKACAWSHADAAPPAALVDLVADEVERRQRERDAVTSEVRRRLAERVEAIMCEPVMCEPVEALLFDVPPPPEPQDDYAGIGRREERNRRHATRRSRRGYM